MLKTLLAATLVATTLSTHVINQPAKNALSESRSLVDETIVKIDDERRRRLMREKWRKKRMRRLKRKRRRARKGK